MTELIKESAPKAIFPTVSWERQSNLYICRAVVRQESDEFIASAVRVPELIARGRSQEEAAQRLAEIYRAAVEHARGQIALASYENTPNAMQFSVHVNAPTVQDIDVAFEEVELTEEQVLALDGLRESGRGRPTIPLVEFDLQ